MYPSADPPSGRCDAAVADKYQRERQQHTNAMVLSLQPRRHTLRHTMVSVSVVVARLGVQQAMVNRSTLNH
jgi:hypothetical protein